MPPAALFLDSPRNRGKNRPKAFRLWKPPTPEIICTNLSARQILLCADGSLPARSPPLSVYRPFRSHARGADAGATVGTPCRSCPKRGGNCPTAAHEVKRRPQMICRVLDGAESHVTRAGFQRARPFGCSCILLAGQKYAPGGIEKSPLQTPICSISSLCAAYYTR